MKNPPSIFTALVLTISSFGSVFGQDSSLRLRFNFDAAPAYTNIVFLPVIFISGVFYDVDTAPQFLRDVAQVLPLTNIIDGLSAALVTGASLADHAGDLAVVIAWGVFGTIFAVRGFSWQAKRD